MRVQNNVKRRIAAEDRQIEKIYREHCAGMQLSVLRIPKLFAMARDMLHAKADEAAIGAAMVAFINNAKE